MNLISSAPPVAMLEAILEQLRDPKSNHGGFVQAIVRRDYPDAAFRADAGNGLMLCEYIKFREWTEQYGEQWAFDYIEKLSAAEALATVLRAVADKDDDDVRY